MTTSKESRYSEPVWWTTQHTIIWEQELPSLRSNFDQRNAEQRRAQIAHQGPDDPVIQKSARAARNVDVDHAYRVADNNWEIGTVWEQVEPGVRYGVGARTQYPHYERWNDELEARLRKEWTETNEPSTWEKVKRAVRHGFESTRKHSS